VITDLGLKYNLLTQYTSFVAIDSEVRNKEGEATTVKQPLPLPEGVSDLSVGGGQPQMARKLSFFAPKSDSTVSEALEAPQPAPAPTAEKEFDSADEDVKGEKKVGSKTFHFKNGIWVDTEHSQKKEIIKIKRGSQAYIDLITAMPELKAYFEAEKNMIVNIGQYSIEIADDGKTELTEDELKKLVEAFKKS
jgi:hypothetical protein